MIGWGEHRIMVANWFTVPCFSACPIDQIADAVVVLFCQYLRWCHESSLIAICRSEKHRCGGDHCLATADITLQKPAHGLRFAQVLLNFDKGTLLSCGHGEGQGIEEALEVVAIDLEGIACSLLLPVPLFG